MLYPVELRARVRRFLATACRRYRILIPQQRLPVPLVGAVGFELTTLCSQSRCATRLRYAPRKGAFYSPTLRRSIALAAFCAVMPVAEVFAVAFTVAVPA